MIWNSLFKNHVRRPILSSDFYFFSLIFLSVAAFYLSMHINSLLPAAYAFILLQKKKKNSPATTFFFRRFSYLPPVPDVCRS